MTASSLRIIFVLSHLFILARCALDISGEAITTRFWDCCKPSCGWKAKAQFSQPVLSCNADGSPADIDAGTGCGAGGSAYLCSDQQPWAVNDTFSYGYAGIYITHDLTGGHIEDFWCCACYQLNFTSDPLLGKSMIVQASNTAYDINTANRFSLAVPGGNTTSHDACASQFGVSQNVFGETDTGVGSKSECDNLPEPLRDGCNWRFNWFQDASYPSASFKRVVCPSELTERTQCVRDDEKIFAGNESLASKFSPALLLAAGLAALVGLLSV